MGGKDTTTNEKTPKERAEAKGKTKALSRALLKIPKAKENQRANGNQKAEMLLPRRALSGVAGKGAEQEEEAEGAEVDEAGPWTLRGSRPKVV